MLVWVGFVVAMNILATTATALPEAGGLVRRDQIRFRTIGVREGLSSITARAIVQDEKGFVWLGTQEGLNRFDGYSFQTYRADARNPDSLSDSHITALAADGRGSLWIGTIGGGLNRMSLATSRMQRFLPGGPEGLVGTQVNALLIARDGSLWIATHDGEVQRLGPNATTFDSIVKDDPRLRRMRAMLELPDGQMLMGGAQGLLIYAPQTQQLRSWSASLDGTQRALSISALVATVDGRIYAGTSGAGLLEFDHAGQLLTQHRANPDAPQALIDDEVLSLLVTRQGELWVGTYQGLSLYQGNDHFLNFVQDASDIGSIGANRIPSMMEDRDGLLWFGTWTAGVSLHKPATRSLRIIRHRGGDPRSIPTNPTRALIRDADGSLWLGLFEGGGLVHYDLERGVLRRYQHDPADPTSLPGDGVQGILRRKNGELWVATSAGVARMNADGDGFTHIDQGVLQVPTHAARTLYETRDETLWIGTEDIGLVGICSGCSDYVNYALDPAHPERSLPGNVINSLHEDVEGMLWIGMNGTGLVRLNRETGVLTSMRAQRGDRFALQSDVITDFLETKDGELWIGTQGAGICRVTRAELPSFEHVTQTDGLSANAIGSIVEDADGLLWVSSMGGIDEYDRKTRRVRNLTASDGFDRSGYFINSRATDESGYIFFGGLLGIVQFHPRDFQIDAGRPNVVLTDTDIYRAGNAQRDVGNNASYLSMLELEHDEPVWMLSFSTMNYANPDSARYSYQLQGLNDTWIELPRGQHMATFTHVPPGKYEFVVRAANAEGLDFGPETRLPVHIQSAPWWSLGARLTYLGGGSVLLLLLGRGMRRRAVERERAQTAIVEREKRLKLALWGSRDELWDLDLQSGKVKRENPLPMFVAGQHVSSEDSLDYDRLVHPEDRAQNDRIMRAHLRGETEFCEMAYRARSRDGDWVWLLTRGQVVSRDRNGRALRMIGTHRDISSVKQAEAALRLSNEALESRVILRTHELTTANQDLQQTLAALQETQNQLIESEKMASLGGLVAGVAHEINTPLGVGITAASHLESITHQFEHKLLAAQLTRTEMDQYLAAAKESSRLILKNLERAGQLVRSFKQVAVDQGSEERRQIHLGDYLQEIAFAMHPLLKRTPHELRIQCPRDIVLDTYPGAIYQIVVNLISNALVHAFTDVPEGLIELRAYTRDPDDVVLEYQDNGVGVPAELLKRIFEPFFTTRRGEGGSGLGLHIVYNRVTQLLGGSIHVENRDGLFMQIRWPRKLPQS